MKELIRITNQDGNDVVSAREIYDFLELTTDFTTWCKRMFEYGFTENLDFTPILGKSIGGRPSTDYALTLDCAKEIAMIQRTEKGKQARQYFIEVEKQYKAKQAPPESQIDFTNPATVLQLAQNWADEQTKRIAAENQVRELQPKADYVDFVLQCNEDVTTGTIAKELGMSAVTLNKKLNEKKIIYKNADGVWVLYAKYQDKGFTDTRTHIYFDSKGNPHSTIHTVWTQKGRNFIHLLLNPSISTHPGESI